MRFAAVQIPAKIGWFSLNGEKLDELHCVALIFGQFAVLHARSARFLHAGIYKAAGIPLPPNVGNGMVGGLEYNKRGEMGGGRAGYQFVAVSTAAHLHPCLPQPTRTIPPRTQ